VPLKTTNSFITSLVNFFKATTDNLLTGSVAFPRWEAPDELKKDTFEKTSAEQYEQRVSEEKINQNPDDMINRGNNYYFSLMVKKSYRLYSRSRIEAVANNKSVEKGLSDPVGFMKTKYNFLGDVVDPNDEISKEQEG